MIKDTLLICCVVICLVLFYRMYVLNQKINSLEEKVSVVDNFSQSIFNYISAKDDNKEEVKEVTYSNNVSGSKLPGNNPSKLSPIAETEDNDDSDSEPHLYNTTTNTLEKDETKSESIESKELLSEMVAELKESLIKTNNENLTNELNQVQELKDELKENSNDDSSKNELFNILNNVSTENMVSMEVPVENIQVELKKKEADLTKLNLNELKNLAKKKNVSLLSSNKPKKKEALIQDILAAM